MKEKKELLLEAAMQYHFNKKVNGPKKVFINLMYKLGIPVIDIGSMTGVSRATVYRHIKR